MRLSLENKYIIYGAFSEKENIVEIEKDDYDRISIAKQSLVNMLYIEEKFNFIVENFLELEQELVKVTLNKMYFPIYSFDWSMSVSDIHLINRRIINLLTTSRMYLDQVSHDLNILPHGKRELTKVLDKIKSTEYDNVLGYRVMEALRNYVQHRGLPVHLLSLNVKNAEFADISEGITAEHSISPFIRLDDLERDGKFKKTILTELKQLGDKINIKNYTREYVQSLSNIQKFIRDILKEDVETWERSIDDAFELYTKQYGEVKMVSIAVQPNHGFKLDRIHLMPDIITRRKWLESKNSELYNVTKKIGSTKAY